MRKKPFVTILLCNLFTALTVLFFSPMEVILANAGEFFFPFGSVWWFQLLVTLAAALLLTGLFCLLPSRVGLVFAAGVLGIGVAAYLQTYPFMNSLMPSLTGKAIRISAAGIAWNLVIWVAIILVAVLAAVLALKKHRPALETGLRALACALVAMQLVGLVSSVLNSSAAPAEKRQDHVLSARGQFGGQFGVEINFM